MKAYMNKYRKLQAQIDAIADYLGISLVEPKGYEVLERKDIGFETKK